jgi:hypothetical protein
LAGRLADKKNFADDRPACDDRFFHERAALACPQLIDMGMESPLEIREGYAGLGAGCLPRGAL